MGRRPGWFGHPALGNGGVWFADDGIGGADGRCGRNRRGRDHRGTGSVGAGAGRAGVGGGSLRPAGQGRSCAPSMPWPRRSATSSPVPHRCRSRSTHRGQLPGGGQGCVRGGAAGAGLGTAVHEQRSGSGAGRRIVDRVAADHRHSGARAVGPDGVWICQSLLLSATPLPRPRRSGRATQRHSGGRRRAGDRARGQPGSCWMAGTCVARRALHGAADPELHRSRHW